MSQFSTRIRQLRKALGLTLREMSETLSIPLSTISKYEQGIIKPGVEILSKVALSYNVNLNWLLTDVGDMFIQDNTFAAPVNNEDCVNLKAIKKNDNYSVHLVSNNFFEGYDKLKKIDANLAYKTFSDVAKELNKPIVVEFSDKKAKEDMRIFYPDSSYEIVDIVEMKKRESIFQSIIKQLDSFRNDERKLEFIDRAIESLADKDALDQLKLMLKGLEMKY